MRVSVDVGDVGDASLVMSRPTYLVTGPSSVQSKRERRAVLKAEAAASSEKESRMS